MTKMLKRSLATIAALCFVLTPLLAQQTPPIMPKVQETPLPPPVELTPPASVPPDVPNRPLTADEAADIALHHQPQVTVAQAGVNSAKGVVQEANAGLYPFATAAVGYNRVNGFLGTANPGNSLPNATGYQATATVRQLIFDFNHTRDSVRQAKLQERAAQANLSRVQSDLVFQTKQSFYTYLQNQRLTGVNESNLRNQQTHLELARARLKAGAGLPVDVVRAETAVQDAILSLNLARTTATLSRVDLASLMGIDPRTPIQASDTNENLALPDDLNVLVDTGLKNRPEVLQAQSFVESDVYGVRAAKTTNAPALITSIGYASKGATFPPDGSQITLGVAVAFTLYDSGLEKGRVTQAKAVLQSNQAQLDAVKISVVSDVSQAYLNLKTAEQRVVTANAEVANAQEGVRITQGRYQSGLGTFLDVLDAQTALVTASTNQVNALSSVELAKVALAHAINAQPQPTQK